MDYEMEELVPIVGKLAEKYTSHESTSITYEKAEQLMGAVLYCIHELWESSGNAPSLNKKLSAQMLGVSVGHAYKLIRKLNQELEKEGFLVIAGKVPRRYFEKRWYGFSV